MQNYFNVKKLLCVGSVNLVFCSLAVLVHGKARKLYPEAWNKTERISLEKMYSKFNSLNIRPEITLNEGKITYKKNLTANGLKN